MRVASHPHAPAALPPGINLYPFYRRLGGPQGRYGRGAENLAPAGVRTPDRPSAVSSYTDWAISVQ